jgi:hypothetical protein
MKRIGAGQGRGSGGPGVVKVVATGVAANTAGVGGEDLTRLYRAVDSNGLKDIEGTGVYRSAPGGLF